MHSADTGSIPVTSKNNLTNAIISVIMCMANKHYFKFSRNEIKKAVTHSKSWRGVLIYLSGGSNYRGSESHIKKRAIKFGIDFSHFPGRGWNKGLNFKKSPIEDYLNNKKNIKSSTLKERLISENLKKYKCENCKKSKWMKKNIPLELHHIDRNPLNNKIENLKLLCPNCHYLEHKSLRIPMAEKTVLETV